MSWCVLNAWLADVQTFHGASASVREDFLLAMQMMA